MINRIVQAISLSLLILGAAIPARAAGDDPAAATVQGFYDALVASMKSGGTTKSRYEKLKPAVEKAFDIPGMTALSVGPSWSSTSPADQKALTDAFERMTIANYARNFDSYSGEKFTVDPAVMDRGSDKLVKSTLKPSSGDAVPFNYRLHQADGGWKIVDIYLNGNISQLAQKRSDFGATLQASGPEGLAKKINALADQTLG
ncbi:MAG TPA: ABC transporter substrate-binding protein [Rhizomicrobium sp.]|jgi:phospholipid transport system substrate-binding protein|nr:ABC transporter substrate-binding protein [Rhizomicrobium sp.]